MSKLLQSKILLGLFVVAIMFVGVVAVSNTASAEAACTITSTLRVGSTGDEVKCLQGKVGATADGKFGPMTATKVQAFQTANSLTADGVVGAMTRAALNGVVAGGTTLPAGCQAGWLFNPATGTSCAPVTVAAGCQAGWLFNPTTGVSCTGGAPAGDSALEGTFGSISTITQLSQYNAEEVGAGQNDVKVLGFKLQASNDGDIKLTSIKLTFDSTGNDSGDSDRLIDYIDSVSILQGSTVIGSADSDGFSKDSTGVYSKSISLTDSIVRGDAEENFYIAVDVINNLDSGDINGSNEWSVGINSIRYEDGSGVVTTDSDSTPAAIEYNSAGEGVNIEFVSYSTAADTELKISLNSTPDVDVVKVDTTNDTNDVVLLKGKLKLDGTSSVWLDEVPVTFTATGAANVEAIASTATLVIDGKEFTETMTTGATPVVVTFNDLDLTIDAGDTVTFTVKADVNDLNDSGVAATDFDAGDSLVASLTTTNRAAMVVENDQGEALTDATEVTGSATGNAQTFFATGIAVAVNSASTTITSDGDSATFVDTVEFAWDITVTNIGDDDVYINRDAADIVLAAGIDAADVDNIYIVDNAGTALTGVTGTIVCKTSCLSADEVTADASAYSGGYSGETFFKVPSNEARTYTVTITGTNATDAKQVRAHLTGLEWTTDLVTDATASDALTATITSYTSQISIDSATPYKLAN